MGSERYSGFALLLGIALAMALMLPGCGGGGSGDSDHPSISIEVPTSAATYSTTGTGIRIGGSISGASFVHVRNAATGFTTDGFVNYFQGYGSWFADIYGLVPGDNRITATADEDGSGSSTASAQITIKRPLQPANLIVNGPDRLSADTYWTDASSFNGSHKFALFADGTGRSTTGSTMTDEAGPVLDFTWSLVGPESIMITGCASCSFQTISRISDSLDEALAYGQVVTVGGAGYVTIDVFVLSAGKL